MAETLRVSTRTLRNWMRLDPATPPRPPGRPRISPDVVAAAREAVRVELERQGWDAGEEPVWRGLGRSVSRYLVRRSLCKLKAERRKRSRARREAARSSVRVLYRDALWAIDSTHLGRDGSGRSAQGEVLRELASGRTVALSVGWKATAVDVIALLERAAIERGGPPLVLASDNDGSYCAAEVGAWLHEHRVVHLRSEPRTPQHNAAAEHGIGELVRDSRVRERGRVVHPGPLGIPLVRSAQRLDHARMRASRDWHTAVEHDRLLASWDVCVDRGRFYATARCAMRRAVLDSSNGRAARGAERRAILQALKDFKLIEWTRGGEARSDAIAESVS